MSSCISESCTGAERTPCRPVPSENGPPWSWVVDKERSNASAQCLTLFGPEPTQWHPKGKGVKDFVTTGSSVSEPRRGDGAQEVTVFVKSGIRGILLSENELVIGSPEKAVQRMRDELLNRIIALHDVEAPAEKKPSRNGNTDNPVRRFYKRVMTSVRERTKGWWPGTMRTRHAER